MKNCLLIGVGSPFAGDAIGWEVVGALARRGFEAPGWRLGFATAARPGPELLDLFEGRDAAVLVDAMVSGAPPGKVRQLTPAQLARHGLRLSSHALGVADTLTLGASLGALPGRLTVVGVELGVGIRPRLIEEVECLVRRWLGERQSVELPQVDSRSRGAVNRPGEF